MAYNWQAESQGSFLSWLLPVATEGFLTRELLAELSDATEAFTKVDLVLEISGVRISGEQLFTRMYGLMRREMEQEAARYVTEHPGWDKIEEAQDAAADILRDAQSAIKRKFEDAGLKFPEEDW